MSALLPLERSVARARRRLFVQSLVNALVSGWAVGLGVGLGWVLAEPWVLDSPPAWAKWAVAGGTVALGTLVAVWRAVRVTPTREATALEIDTRFGLRERVTTALTLAERDAASPAGQAVVADAAAKVAPLKVADRFPVRVRWHALMVPALAGCLVAAAVFYHPDPARIQASEDDPATKKAGDAAKIATNAQKKAVPFTKPKAPDDADRARSEKMKDLENELDKLAEKWAKDPFADTPEKQREKVTEVTKMEEKLKEFSREKLEKLSQMEKQLSQLDKLNKDKDFSDGPAKGLNDALAKSDLKKAKDEVDELRKKAKDKDLDKTEQEKLAKQLDKMKDEVEKLARNKEREEELKKLIDKAKEEGRDAESLERELERTKAESKESSEALQELADTLKRAQQAAEKGDLDELARELGKAGDQIQGTEDELKDLESAQEYLQRLKQEREAAAKGSQGNPDGDGDGNDRLGKKGGNKGKGKGQGEGDTDQPNDGGIGAGRRPINEDAKTSSAEERIKGLFDPTGKKSYGGATKGQAFNKKTTAEFGKEIREAVQEAPVAADSQRLPRDARDAVKEYFQSLGGQNPGGNK
jgi:hypothetical protein